MEWAKETAKNAKDTVVGSSDGDSTGTTYEKTKDTANQAYNTTKDTASKAIGKTTDAAASPVDSASDATNQVLDYVPDVTSEKTTAAAVINSAPFRSFKPDPSTVWKAYLIYVLLASASTLPWWAFIFAADYFQYLYPEAHIVRLFALAYFVPWLLAYVLVCFFWREGSSWIKVNVGGTIAVVALLVIPFLDGFFMGDTGTTATFWVTLVVIAITGCADAISQGSIMGIASELPESFTKAYSCGVTASGVFLFIVRLITKGSLSNSARGLRISGIVHFSIAALFVVLVLGLFSYVHYMPEMGYYNSLNLGSFDTVRLLIQDEGSVTIEIAAGAAIAALAAGRTAPAKTLYWKAVLNHIKALAIASFVTSFFTFIIFPGALAENIAHWPKLGDYSALVLLGTFIVFDLCGRLYTIQGVTQKHSTIFGLAWLRLLVVVFFIFALLFDDSVVSSVIMMMFLTVILGFTHGYLVSTLTVRMPKSTPGDLAETAGILNAVIMNLGVVVGAGLSWLLILI